MGATSRYNRALLVVEDDVTSKFIFETALRQCGAAQVHVVSGTGEAMDYLSGKGPFADRKRYPFPSFILTELNSPSVDGRALLAELRKNPDWAAVPVAVFASEATPEEVRCCYELGARTFHVVRGSYAEMRKELSRLHRYWAKCEVPRLPSSLPIKTRESQRQLH